MKVTDKMPDYELDRVIVDVASVLRANHMVGRSEEGWEITKEDGEKQFVNDAEYAYDNWVQSYMNVLAETETAPFQTVICMEGANSRALRQLIYPGYKAKRVPMPPEVNEQYNLALEMVEKTILSLGGTVVKQDGMEGDDLVAYLSKKLKGRKTIWCQDEDLKALQKDDVDIYYKGEINPPMKGCPEPEWINIYKALVGDASDCLPGAKGFGAKAFLKLVETFGDGGMDAMRDMLESGTLRELEEDVTEFKPLQKILDSENMVYQCYECAKFMDHKINTLRNMLDIKSGYCMAYNSELHHPDLEKFFANQYLVTDNDFEDYLEAIHDGFNKSPFVTLDIEASTPPESDAWCKIINESGKTKRQKYFFDSFGFELTGMSLTFGDNLQDTIYLPTDHLDTENIAVSKLRDLVNSIPDNTRIIVHNSSFELPTLFRAWGESDLDNGFRGFVKNVWCTVLMHQYVDENSKSGLKGLSKKYFNYEQATYGYVTGGKKMNELSADHVTSYACDDTIMTAAIANRYQLIMEIENTIDTFQEVEFFTQYVCADAFNQGIKVDVDRLDEIEAEDAETFKREWKTIRAYLKNIEWPGTYFDLPEKFAAQVKYCFRIIYGEQLKTRFAVPAKLAVACKEAGAGVKFSAAVEISDIETLVSLAKKSFTGEPEFEIGSSKKMQKIMYEHMMLKVRLRGKPTQKMRDAGVWKGNPKADADAIAHALHYDVEAGSETDKVLRAFKAATEVETRRTLFYTPYRTLLHWKDGRFHPNLGQSRTTTRRFGITGPNLSQMSKRGEGKKLRELILPDHENQVVLACDYSSQEIYLTADVSKDENLLSCCSGDNKKDVHSVTAAEVAKLQGVGRFTTYESLKAAVDAGDATAKKMRTDAKSVNFGFVYQISASGLSVDLLIKESEAKRFLEAYEKAYPGVVEWCGSVVDELKLTGESYTRMGGVRHLHTPSLSGEGWEVKRAERQAINFRIQASAAEQMKLAMSRLWLKEEMNGGDARFAFVVHDEIVSFVPENSVSEYSDIIVTSMCVKYADMSIEMGAGSDAGPNFGQLK